MTTMQARRFTTTGVERFREQLDLVRSGGEIQLAELLDSPEYTTSLETRVDIEVRGFDSRLDAGLHFFEALRPMRELGVDLLGDVGLWSWLAARWYELLLPQMHRQQPGEDARWILQPGRRQRYYRHLLATPYRLVTNFHDDLDGIRVITAGPLARPGQVFESLVANQKVISTPALLRAATELYFDADAGELKKGAGDKGEGAVRRFVRVQAQFSRTYDLNMLSADQVLDLFPREFDRFRT